MATTHSIVPELPTATSQPLAPGLAGKGCELGLDEPVRRLQAATIDDAVGEEPLGHADGPQLEAPDQLDLTTAADEELGASPADVAQQHPFLEDRQGLQDTEVDETRLLVSRDHFDVDRRVAPSPGDELRPVLRLPHGRGGDRDGRRAIGVDHRAAATQSGDSPVHGVGRHPAHPGVSGLSQPDHLLVTGDHLEAALARQSSHHQVDRIGADVDGGQNIGGSVGDSVVCRMQIARPLRDPMTPPHPLVELGWNTDIAASLGEPRIGEVAGRVMRVDRGEVDVAVAIDDVVRATMTTAAKDCVAGDWVMVDTTDARVTKVAPRHTAFVRRAARGATRRPDTRGEHGHRHGVSVPDTGSEPPAARNAELVLAHQSGAAPLVVLTKSDLSDPAEIGPVVESVRAVAPDVDVVVVSSVTDEGLDGLLDHIGSGVTFALLGASGVGKSAMANALAGRDIQTVGAIRDVDGKGRHTTSSARLIAMPDGSLLLDTPGVRALAMWEAWEGLAAAFPEITELETRCQFADCYHDDEPGCAVNAAVTAGRVSADRLESWRRLRDEMVDLDDAITEQTRRRSRTGRPES